MNSSDDHNTEETASTTEKKKSRWLVLLRPRYAIPLIVIALLIALPISYRRAQIARLPDIGDPFDVEEFLSYTVPDERNAYVEYRQAEKLWVRFKGTYEEQSDPKNWNWKTASPEIKKWFDDNQKALEVWYRGTQKPEGQYIHSRDVEYKVVLPVIRFLHEIHQLAILKSSILQSENDYCESLIWLKAAIRFSTHLGNVGGWVARSDGISLFVKTTPRISFWAKEQEVDEVLLQKALKEIRNHINKTVHITDLVKTEYLWMQSQLQSNSFEKRLELIAAFLDGRYEKLEMKVSSWLNGEPEIFRRLIKIVFKNHLDHLSKPLNSRPTTKGVYELFCDNFSDKVLGTTFTWQEFEKIDRYGYAINSMHPYERIEMAIFYEQASQHCLEVVLAAQIYRRQRGTFPSKLEDLKEILGKIPVDPLASKTDQPLRYRKESDGFVVWSVGENSIDDGGDVGFEEAKKYCDIGFRVKQ